MYNCILKYIPLKNLSKLQFGDNLPSSKKNTKLLERLGVVFLEVLVSSGAFELNWWIPFPKNKKLQKPLSIGRKTKLPLLFFFYCWFQGVYFCFSRDGNWSVVGFSSRTTNLTRCRCTRWCWGLLSGLWCFFWLGWIGWNIFWGVEKPHGKMLQYAPCREDLPTFYYTSKTNVGTYSSPMEHICHGLWFISCILHPGNDKLFRQKDVTSPHRFSLRVGLRGWGFSDGDRSWGFSWYIHQSGM